MVDSHDGKSGEVAKCFEGVSTEEMDAAFLGLSDECQRFVFGAMADPSRMAELAESLSNAATEELQHYVANLTPEERAAVDRALLLD